MRTAIKTSSPRQPKEISINEETYNVSSKPKLFRYINQNKKKKKQELRGLVDLNTKEISLSSSFSPEEQVSTCYHEILHAIIHEFKLPIDGRCEESFVLAFEKALIQLFKDNPRLLIWTMYKLSL